jgi:hypothetical protein
MLRAVTLAISFKQPAKVKDMVLMPDVLESLGIPKIENQQPVNPTAR